MIYNEEKHEVLQAIMRKCGNEEELFISHAFEDGGVDPLFPRLERAAMNQVDGGEAMPSRYGIWGNTVRDNIREALSLLDRGQEREAARLLRRSINALSAFSEIQALLDPLDAEHPTISPKQR